MTTNNAINLGTTIGISNGGTNATSFTQSAGIVVYNGTSLVNYAGPQIDSSGRATNTTQPAFLALLSGNQTISNSTQTTVAFNTVSGSGSFDNDSNFNTSNHYFVAPIAGVYLFTTTLLANTTASTTSVIVNINDNNTYTDNRVYQTSGGITNTQIVVCGTSIFKCAANDQISVLAAFSGNVGSVALLSGFCKFSGYLIG